MAFATPGQLATRLGRQFTSAETSQAAALLDDATAYLQAEIGQLVEAGTMTVTLQADPDQIDIRLPQWPVRGVTGVVSGGVTVTDYEVRGGDLVRCGGWPSTTIGVRDVVVTYDYGILDVPTELSMWCCVLAAGAMAQALRGGTLGASGVASERIDDYAINYADDSTAFNLPERILERLRASYGAGAHVTSPR
jgi:hypothetical protein